jgi:hypothetical protein
MVKGLPRGHLWVLQAALTAAAFPNGGDNCIFRTGYGGARREQVNAVESGLTTSIWTSDRGTARGAGGNVEAGYIWINDVSKHFLGTPFSGDKQSGSGRGGVLGRAPLLYAEKNNNINLAPSSTG